MIDLAVTFRRDLAGDLVSAPAAAMFLVSQALDQLDIRNADVDKRISEKYDINHVRRNCDC